MLPVVILALLVVLVATDGVPSGEK